MEDPVARGTIDLYESDFYAWTQRQAELIRHGDVAAVDLSNILEEIETLGRKEVSELRSRYTVLATHLLKQMFQPARAGRSWRTTILNQRIAIARHVNDNPSLKSKAEEIFAEAYADARLIAASKTGLPEKFLRSNRRLIATKRRPEPDAFLRCGSFRAPAKANPELVSFTGQHPGAPVPGSAAPPRNDKRWCCA